jgi:hypothetical protein
MLRCASLAVAVAVASCGGLHGHGAAPAIRIESYRPPRGTTVAFSGSGKTAIVRSNESRWGMPDDLLLVERATGHVLGKAHGWAVATPSDTEAYAVIDHWLVRMTNSDVRADLELPRAAEHHDWHMQWSTIDHAAGTALIAFAEQVDLGSGLHESDADMNRTGSRYELVEVDLATMQTRGRSTISVLGSVMPADAVGALIEQVERDNPRHERVLGEAPMSCDFAAVGDHADVYTTCRVPEPRDSKLEHWVTTRYRGRTLVWSTSLETPTFGARGEVLTALAGDGSTLVIRHGHRPAAGFEPDVLWLVDAATGNAALAPSRPAHALGDVGELVFVPGEPAVAQVHIDEPLAERETTRSFHGLSIIETRTGNAHVVLDARESRELREAIPGPIAILPGGTYLFGY